MKKIKGLIRKIRYIPTYCQYLPYHLVNSRIFYEICKNAEPKQYPRLLKAFYHAITGEKLNLEDPKTFNEKIQWMKLYDSTPLKTQLADKYAVREWIKEKIGGEYLIPILGVWDSFDEIDFDLLPEQFVLKANHGSGWIIIVKDKSSFDRAEAKCKFDHWLNTNFAFVYGLELQYKDIQPKVIAEEYLGNIDGKSTESLRENIFDYKIHCFHGEPKIVQVIGNRDLIRHKAQEACFDLNWRHLLGTDQFYDEFGTLPEKPDNLDEMLDVARKLSQEFKYVRVDLYDIKQKIIFGEMTFTPSSGTEKWRDDAFSRLVGSWI